MNENLNRICRLCLKDSETLVSLFENFKNVFFPDIIKESINVIILKDDNFPPNVCNLCIEKVESVVAIRREFQENDAKLREIILNRPPEEEDDGVKVQPKEENKDFDFNPESNEPTEIKLENLSEMVSVNINCPSDYEEDDEIKAEVKSEKADLIENESDDEIDYDAGRVTDESDSEDKQKLMTKEPKAKKVPRSNNYKCYVCNEQLLTALELDTHLPTHMDKIPFKCHFCIVNSVVVRNLAALNQHMKMHEKPNKCDFCDKRFNTTAAKKFHIDQVHLEAHESIECQICHKKCANKAYMSRHMKMHNGDYKCLVCGKCFSNNTSLKRHGLIHSGEKPFKCQICVKTFKDKSNYRTHMQIHNGDKAFECKECPSKFVRASQLDQHVKAYHSDDSKARKRAPKKRPDIDYLCKLKEGTQEQYFECKTCGKSYSTPQRVVHHIATHNKSHQCTVCGKIFLNPSRLAEHENQHTGNRPFTCEYCGMKFSYSCTLRRHKRTHTGEKNYHCKVCERSFRYTDNLKKHMLTHTGEKPFECVICDKRFRDKRSYTKHTAKHTELSAPQVVM